MAVGILGYGNLGASLYRLLCESGERAVVFSNRIAKGEGDFYPTSALNTDNLPLDALLLAHGSAGNYREELSFYVQKYHTVSAYDIHENLLTLKNEIEPISKKHHTVSILGVGWDPGLLSVIRAWCKAIFPHTNPKTVWGEGVSEGHSFVLRQIEGVEEGIQYTVPTETGHKRVCYVVCDCAQQHRVEKEILSHREYFTKETTEIHFISREDFLKTHKGNCYHRGSVRATSYDGTDTISFEVSMQRNPDFTARIMIAYLNAIRRLAKEEKWGAYSPLDLSVSYLLSPNAYSLW